MIQKAILQIDCSRGVNKSSSSGGRFQAGSSVTAAAADRLRRGTAASPQRTGMAQGGMAQGGMAQGGMAQGGMAQGGMAQSGTGVRDGTVTVQYNPASIKYRASTPGQKTEEREEGTRTKMVTSIPRQSTLEMSFDLVFHSTGEGDESVREQMELVMNMIYDSPTKGVRFAWGELVAEGKLIGFSGEYDMFDASGRPVSGRMSLTVRIVPPYKQVDKAIDEIGRERINKPAAQDKGDGQHNEAGVSAAEKKVL